MSVLPGPEPAVFAFGPFVLDRQRRSLTRGGASVTVTPKAFDLLVVLVERGGAVVTKDALMSALWPDTTVDENNLTFQISTLRKALGSEGASYVATIPGRGYQFAAPLETIIEDEERTTIVVSSTQRRSLWAWGIALALLLAGGLAAIKLLQPKPPPAPAIRSLAVLPFKPIAGAQRDEALELGMADTLITRLSHMPGIIIRPTSAVRRYSKLDDDPLDAARALGVDAVVDGSIQRSGSRMRVTVRLLRTSDGKPIWADQLDQNASDLFAVQDRVADNVARVVVPALSGPVQAQLARKTTGDLQAYDLYLKGRYLAESDPARAEEFFRRAIARDARFAAAWAAIADSWLFRGRYRNRSPREQYENARAAALRAVALDPELADAHAALGQVYSDHDWDWKRAEEEYRRALALNPNCDVAHGQYAYLLLFRGDTAGALEHSRQAMEIDPVSLSYPTIHGFALDCAGRYDEAIRVFEELLRARPGFTPALLHLGIAYTNAGKPEIGIAKLKEGLAIHPGSTQLLGLEAFAQARAGHRDIALQIVRDLEARAAKESVSQTNLAAAWTALGDHDRASYWLESAYRERIFLLRVITVAPAYAPLRGDPRYADLVRRMGL
jgi:DNA-binding winged helix-turn-helix (wHTH) protein/TolB-like protein/Flp pilus assembly protein TadD